MRKTRKTVLRQIKDLEIARRLTAMRTAAVAGYGGR
jgi:hypothetical protein